jgi:hypothetical protein
MSRYNGRNDKGPMWMYLVLIIIFGLYPPIGVHIVLGIVFLSN